MTEKEKVKAATEVARNLGLETVEAKEALIEAAGGAARPALLGEDGRAPAPGVFDLYWAGQLLSRLPTAPNLNASKSPLKAARDRGCDEAGVVYAILGDGARLPDLPDDVIEAAAVWAVTYIEGRIAHPGDAVPGDFAPSKKIDLIKDLFLRCLDLRRIGEFGFGQIRPQYEAAAFFRKMFDLGGSYSA